MPENPEPSMNGPYSNKEPKQGVPPEEKSRKERGIWQEAIEKSNKGGEQRPTPEEMRTKQEGILAHISAILDENEQRIAKAIIKSNRIIEIAKENLNRNLQKLSEQTGEVAEHN